MGRQVNFYMYGSDEEEFLRIARKEGCLRLLPYASAGGTPEPVETLPKTDEPGSFMFWLWNETLSEPPVMYQADPKGRAPFFVHSSSSEVIEFSRSHVEGRVLQRGRLWAELSGWRLGAPTHQVSKSESFQQWFKSLTSWIRRHYSRMPTGAYAGPCAAEFQRGGGHLR